MNSRLLSIVLLSGVALLRPSPAWSQLDGIESAQRALERTRQPWYDSESDGLKSMAALGEEAATRGDWRGRDRPDWSWNWGNWGGPSFSWFGELMKLLVWTVLIGLLAVLVYALVQTFRRIEAARSANLAGQLSLEDEQTQEQRIENLPVNVRKKKGDFLDLARGYYEAGDFAEAIVYLFSHRLLQLDKAGWIRLAKGKTNRQYLLELAASSRSAARSSSASDLQKILGQTMTCFEDVFFGQHTMTRERFEGCWNRNESFQRLIQRVAS